MKKILSYFLFITVLLLQNVAFGQQINYSDMSKEDFVEGKIRIKLKREHLNGIGTVSNIAVGKQSDATSIGIDGIDKANKENGIKRITRVFPFSIKNEAKHRAHGLDLWFELDFDNTIDPASIADNFSILTEVDIAKPVYAKTIIDGDTKPRYIEIDSLKLVSKSQTNNHASLYSLESNTSDFNDPLLSEQWHYSNDGTIGTVGSDINLIKAWTRTTGSSDVIVAIVDGGIDTEHEDLIDNLWVNEAELNGKVNVDDDNNGFVDDIHGYNFAIGGVLTAHEHGTHVAGTVGAVNNNGIGVAGVAGGNGSDTTGVKLISCQVFDNRLGSGGNFAAAMVYGADNGAIISQNSWGYNQPGFYEPEIRDAIKYFIEEAGQYEGSPMKGGIVIFAAGNTGRDEAHLPGAFPEVLAVASLGPSDYPAPYSTYGDWVDISAPGGDQSNFGLEGGVLSTLPGNKYGYFQGTSMACPHVSGVAALVISKFGGDSFRPEDLRKTLINSTNEYIFDGEGKYGVGSLNAADALAEDEIIAPDAITDLSAPEISHDQITLSWTVPEDEDNFQPADFYLAISESEITETNFNNQEILLGFNNPYEAGSIVSVVLSGFTKQSKYWFAIKSADRYENISDISNIISVVTTDEPSFAESTRDIEVVIDVNGDSRTTVPISFSNVGEGLIYWNSFTVNENDYWIDQEEWKSDLQKKAAKAAETPELFKTTSNNSISASAFSAEMLTEREQDKWVNDNTVFMSYYSYLVGYGIDKFVGTGNPNAGFIHASRFEVPKGKNFNITHLALALYPNTTKDPLVIIIKRGSENLEDSEIVHIQDFYADEVDVPKFYRVPIYKPQNMQDGDYFWIELHFPKEWSYPLGVQNGPYTPYVFKTSVDNGVTYEDAWNHVTNAYPWLSVYSTGKDGSYVFMNPNEGSIAGGESQDIEVEIDGSQLSNGKHLASLGISTNDKNKPGINIEVKVLVKGQVASAKIADLTKYEVDNGIDNNLEIEVTNNGLDNLIIYDVKSLNDNHFKNFEEDIVILPGLRTKIPFVFVPNSIGILQDKVTLVTNIGDVDFSTYSVSVDAPIAELSIDNNVFNVLDDGTAEFDLTIKNTGTGTPLEYDLSLYSRNNLEKGLIADKLSLSILTKDSLNGPTDGTWDDISEFGKGCSQFDLQYQRYDFENSFPFYSVHLDHVWVKNDGRLYSYRYGAFGNVEVDKFYETAQAMFLPISFSSSSGFISLFKSIKHYSFGDKEVFSFVNTIRTYDGGTRIDIGDIEYQIVFFRDGSVEFRYKNVDAILQANIPSDGYVMAGIQGMEKEEYIIYKDYAETKDLYNGMVIRFVPNNDVSMIVFDGNPKGVVAQGDSTVVKLTVEPEIVKTYGGSYINRVLVETNTDNKLDIVDSKLNINVTSTNINLSAQDSLIYGSINSTKETSRYLKVVNDGTNVSTIDNIYFGGNSAFYIKESFPIILNGKSNIQLPIYANSTIGSLESTFIITYGDGSVETVVVTGDGKENPTYTTDLLSNNLKVDIIGGEKITIPFNVTNISNDVDLEYAFINSTFASVNSDKVVKASDVNKESITEDYGYTWAVSDSKKVFREWNDITGDSDTIHVNQGDQKVIYLPFEFPFYGEKFNKIWVSRNGYITVVEPTEDPTGVEFEKDDGVSGIIAPFLSRLIPSIKGAGILLKMEEDRIILQWSDYMFEGTTGGGGPISFQMEIIKDGSIYFHYDLVSPFSGILNYGLESPDESEVFETKKSWILSWTIIKDYSTIAISPPLVSRVEKEDTFNLVLSAERIYHSGVYNDTIEFYTNSNTIPTLKIPVVLNVTGTGVLSVNDTINGGDIVYEPNSNNLEKEITFYNSGFETINIDNIKFNGLEDLLLFDKDGKSIRIISNKLYPNIEIEPWEEVTIKAMIPIVDKVDINGDIEYLSDGNIIASTKVLAKLVDTPIFSWNAVDQNLELNSTDLSTYKFTISNSGETTLKYEFPSSSIGGGVQEPNIVEEIGKLTYGSPTVVDSLANDFNDGSDGAFTPFVHGPRLGFASEYIAPDAGFYITHVKIFNNLKRLDEYVQVQIFIGGDSPGDTLNTTLMYQQNYVIDKLVESEWVYYELETPVSIPPGEKFFVAHNAPVDAKYVGFDLSSDPEINGRSWSAVYQTWTERWVWNGKSGPSLGYVYKIRPLTANGEGLWISLDQSEGEIAKGESIDVTATIDTKLSGFGEHNAVVSVLTNDINNKMPQISVDINVNGAPVLDFGPNTYTDSLTVIETEKLSLNYLFSDPEGDEMTITISDFNEETILTKFEQTSGKTAKMDIETNYESKGVFTFPVEISDTNGNITRDTVAIKVIDKNRSPILNPEYETITLNIADPSQAFSIDVNDLFTDPDGDNLQILAGNYTPEILDMAIGGTYIDLHAKAQGTGFIVLGADDGREDGFVLYGVYVIIINDPDAVGSSLDGYSKEAELLVESGKTMTVYPNPVVNTQTNILFKIDETSSVAVDMFDIKGRKVSSVINDTIEAGLHKENLNMAGLESGVYFCKLVVNGELKDVSKVLVK